MRKRFVNSAGKKYEFTEDELQLIYDKKLADAAADQETAAKEGTKTPNTDQK
jgi:hypothetical protein